MNNICIDLLNEHNTVSDKYTLHNYIPFYNLLFDKFKNKPINFLEIGLFYGDSIKLWDNHSL